MEVPPVVVVVNAALLMAARSPTAQGFRKLRRSRSFGHGGVGPVDGLLGQPFSWSWTRRKDMIRTTSR